MKKEKLKEREINQKTHIKLHTSQNKGITLIALIITIVVLLILAVVAIRAVQGDGIISHAKNAQTSYNDAQDKEQIQLALNEWEIVGATTNKTFAEFMAEKFGADKVTANGEDEVTVTLENGHQYKVKKDGTITSTKGIVLSPSPMTLELQEGTTATKNLTARLNGIEGEISWSIPEEDKSIATISAEIGESITVTAVAKGSTTITATCGSYKATCTVTVEEPIEIGSYVQYNVGYTDMYLTEKNYNATNGWRLLSATPVEGQENTYTDVKLISTGIPAKLYYDYSTNATTNGWWVPAGSTAEFRAELTRLGDKSYTTYSSADETDSNYPAMRATAGMYNNFEAISFRYGTSNDENKGFYTSITKYGATTQEDITYSENSNATATPTGGELFNLYGDNAKVRLLTLPELNMAVRPTGNTTNIDNTTQISGAEDPTGLFRLNKLDSAYYGGYYWLASPYPGTGNGDDVCGVYFFGNVYGYKEACLGVRPVVTLSSNIQLVDTDGDGVLEIK